MHFTSQVEQRVAPRDRRWSCEIRFVDRRLRTSRRGVAVLPCFSVYAVKALADRVRSWATHEWRFARFV